MCLVDGIWKGNSEVRFMDEKIGKILPTQAQVLVQMSPFNEVQSVI